MEVLLTIANIVFVTILLSSLLALCPSPLQQFCLSLFRRGKLLQQKSSSSKLGVMERLTVPQSFFLHFYIIGALCPGLILSLLLAYIFLTPISMVELTIEGRDAWRNVVLLCLLELQILRRLYENMFVSKFSKIARMSAIAYLGGILYYVFVPLLVFPRAEAFSTKMLQVLSSSNPGEIKINFQGWKPLFEIGWPYCLSTVMFMWGWLHQYRCHFILASLRSKEGAESNVYKIPYGDWFEYVSSAHYFAEFVMYFSFVLARGGRDLESWLLFSAVVVNLWVAAIDTHKWYTDKFEDYPESRKAVIPFMY